MTVKAAFIAPDDFETSGVTMRQIVQAAFPTEGVLGSGGVVTPAGIGGMAVDVTAFRATLTGDLTNQGGYFVWQDGTDTVPWAAAHGSLPRWDSLVLRVSDSEYGAVVGSQGPFWQIVQGTAAASPVVPSDAAIAAAMTSAGTYRRWADVKVLAGATAITGGANIVQSMADIYAIKTLRTSGTAYHIAAGPYGALVDLPTGTFPTTSIIVPPSGKVRYHISANMFSSTNAFRVGFRMTGANTASISDYTCLKNTPTTSGDIQCNSGVLQLAPGLTNFVWCYLLSTGGTADIASMKVDLEPVMH